MNMVWLVWYTYPSEKYEFVTWDYSSQYMESHKLGIFHIYKTPIHVPLILVTWDSSQYGKVIIHSMVPVTSNQIYCYSNY